MSEPLRVISYPHPVLLRPCKTVRRVDAAFKALAAEMLELMYAHNGVGLAANQVGVPLRLFVANPSGQRGEGEEWICINPELNLPKGNETDREGCLSLPEIFGPVPRPTRVKLNAYDLAGNEIQRDLSGFPARVVQHECDHLDGVFFFHRMSEWDLQPIEGDLAELDRVFRQQQESGQLADDEALLQQAADWEKRYA